ncbi:MAG: choice-of-anchor D domain-containing protein [Cyanobacteria bacterium P01_A01_bin.37]
MVQTLTRISMQSTETPNLLLAARSGNADAIAQLIGRALAHQGVSVSGTITGEQLELQLAGNPLPEQQQVIPLIKHGLMRLGFTSIRSVALQSHTTETLNPSTAGWTYRFQIVESLNTPLPQRPETESLVRIHGGEAPVDQTLHIGSYCIYESGHGHVIHHRQDSSSSLRRRSPPAPGASCEPVPSLLDRQPETQDALAGLSSGQPVEFYGGHGLGKSSMLRNLAHTPLVRRQFTDGVHYHRAASQPLDDALQSLFEVFYDWDSSVRTKPTPSELHAALRSINGLAVLDDLPPGDASLLKDVGMTILMASDEHQLKDVGQAIPMRGLPIPEAIALVEQRLGRSLEDDVEKQAAGVVCRALKGHPLRIIQNIGFLQAFRNSGATTDLPSTLPQLAAQLQSGLSSDALTIRAATTLPELERRVLAVLAVFEHIAIAPEHLNVLVGSSNLDLTFQILLERGLICRDVQGYRLASNLLHYFRKIWDLTPWTDRSITYFTTWAQQQETMTSLLNTHSLLWWVAQLAFQRKQWEDVLSLCQILDHPFMLGKRWGRWRQMWELGLAAARSMGDGAAEAYAFHQLGSRALCLGDLFTAHTYLTEATQRRAALRDEVGAAISQHNANLLFVAQDERETQSSETSSESLTHTPSTNTDLAMEAGRGQADKGQPSGAPVTRIQQQTIVSVPHPPTVSQQGIDQAKIDLITSQIGTGKTAKPSSTQSAATTTQSPADEVVSARVPRKPSPQSISGHSPSTGHSPRNGAIAPTQATTRAIAQPATALTTQATTTPRSPVQPSTGPTSSKKITPPPHASVPQPGVDPSSPPKVYAATEARKFPIGWIAVASMAALFGGIGAFVALNWNRAPFSIDPKSVTFTPQLVNRESSVRTITITNTGRENVELSSIAFSEGDRLDFAIEDESCTQRPLRPKADCMVELTFNPRESNTRSTVLRVADRTGEHVRFVQVRGIGESAEINAQPDGLSFAPTLVGRDEQATQTITITNESAVQFSMGSAFISGERADAFTITHDGCEGQSLSPNDTCTVDVTFTPPGAGIFEANFAIRDATNDQTWLRALIGTGELSAPAVFPATVSFGAEVIGRLSTRTVTIRNTGGSDLDISRASISGNTTNFRIQGDGCSRNSLQPGEQCNVTVGFNPQAERSYSATLIIQDNAVNSPRSVAITGQGSRVASPGLSPSPLTFGEQELGTTRQESITMTNRGNESIQVQGVSISQSNDFAIVNETCTDGTLAAGGTCTVTVGFTPQESGDRSATISIRDNATGSPRTVDVTGAGSSIPSPQILAIEATPEEVPPGERSRICYRAVNAERLTLRDTQSGQSNTVDPDSGCATVTPSTTTAYVLTAEGRNGQSVTQQVQVRVSDPDTTPPPTPTPLTPMGNEYVLCPSTSTVNLSWNPVVDDSDPVTYTAMLERGIAVTGSGDQPQGWTLVTQQNTTASQVNITPFLEKGRVSYRWRVNAQDAAGNVSALSNWLNFRTCD